METRLTETDPDVLAHGHGDGAGGRAVPHRRRRQRGRDVRVPARRPERSEHDEQWTSPSSAWGCTRSAASGESTGDRDGRDRDPPRARRRGRRVARHPVRVRRQLRGRQPRRGRRAARAHRHPVHRRLQRLRDRGERADARGQHDPPRRPRPRHRGRHGQAPARRVQRRPAPVRVPVVVRRARPVRHHEVLRDEDQQVHARPRHLARDARQGRGEELPQRRAEPERVPAQAAVRGGDPRRRRC